MKIPKKKIEYIKMSVGSWQHCPIAGFNLWILVSALVFHVFPSFIVLHNFLLVDLPPSLALHVSFCPKIYSFSKAGISFQVLGCTFVSPESPHEVFYTNVCSWQVITHLLIDIPKFYGKCGFNSVLGRPSSSSSFNVMCFKTWNQLLGQIEVTHQLNRATNSITEEVLTLRCI